MTVPYDHKKIEKKWQQYWVKNKTFRAPDDSQKPEYYVLDMFPYPSSAGLHVGHPLGYTATDIISRFLRMNGYNVLHPMGWDAFGLPAENYAIKTKVHPKKSTVGNIETFKRQIQELGFSYDWDREIATCLPDYYLWTQWFFAFLYKNGLAYKKEAPANWCDSCNTVLANEQVVDGRCERCKNQVVQKYMSQWFFRITDFIDDNGKTSGLLSGLDKIDWPNSTKIAQRNWIGRSEGVNWINQKVKGMDIKFEMYDSVPQTFHAQTFCVIAPEHPVIFELVKNTEYEQPVMEFVERIKTKKMTKKFDVETDLEGIFTGRYIDNPFDTGDLPIWVASFVVMDYGTGVVHSSAHDERDFAFAKKHDIPLRAVMFPPDPKEAERVRNLEYCYHHDPEGVMERPPEFTGRKWGEVREDLIGFVEKKGYGRRQVNYKMRDWLVSRQRYWGSPIPIVYDDRGGEYLLPDDEMPVHLPDDVDFMPHGESPLAQSKTFHDPKDFRRIEEKLKKSGAMPQDRKIVSRENDTMDTFVCSSWYMFRFMDPYNEKEFASKELLKKWGPVDLYVGGAEHTVLHLLYSRFFTKALHKYGYVEYDEPFSKLRHQGMILGEDGQKMSKSLGNVVNPDEVIAEFGADTMRCYEMFMGPFKQKKPWSMGGVQGVSRFLDRFWRVFHKPMINESITNYELQIGNKNLNSVLHQTIKIVTEHITDFRFNTAISQMMVLTNELMKLEKVPREALEKFALILSPFAPHMAEEVWAEVLGHKETLVYEPWPKYDAKYLVEEKVRYAVQVNGKVRDDFEIAKDAEKSEVLKAAKETPGAQRHLEGKEIVKEIFVPGSIAGFVVK